MFFINLIVILLYLMLAILSRKNCSKYKDNMLVVGKLKALHMAMGETIFMLLKKTGIREDTKKSIRKLYVVSPAASRELANKYRISRVAICLFLLMVFNATSLVIGIYNQVNPKEQKIRIQRKDYAGEGSECEVTLAISDENYEYSLFVAPQQYTEEEFLKKGNKILDELEESILGENQSAENVCVELVLYPEDFPNEFSLEWDSSDPDLIDINGLVYRDKLAKDQKVVLTAYITYMDFALERDYEIWLKKEEGNTSLIREVEAELEELELNSRNDEFIELPHNIKGVDIGLKKETNHSSIKVFILGIMACVIALTVKKEKLTKAEKERDNMLIRVYPAFVNKLWLLLGTGMTMKNALSHIVSEAREKNILVREIEYSLNQIKTGLDEAFVYEELGRRLDLPMYSRLMNQVSHNLKRGNSSLFEHMEEEVNSSMEMKKDYGKRQGEEASTKLLFPMIMLMAVVMVIVIIPAITGF